MSFRDSDYEPLQNPRKMAAAEGDLLDEQWLPSSRTDVPEAAEVGLVGGKEVPASAAVDKKPAPIVENWSSQRGHAATFAALVLYTAIAYFRPYELWPALKWTEYLPYWIAAAMVVIFIPSQFMAEGTPTARPKEVNLALLLGLIAILSIPQAIDRTVAWDIFYSLYSKTIIVFLVMVNALRSERRLRTMILLALVTGGIMSITALIDYSAGRTGIYAERAANVAISNMFGEPNSLAMHLVTMTPIALALSLGSTNVFKKLLYLAGSLVMIAGVFATFSRGGFLGLVAAGLVLAWKIGRKNRAAVLALVLIAVLATMLFAPGGYGTRVSTIFTGGESSYTARRELLTKSLWVAVRSPLLGVGIGNERVVLIHDQVSHNSYTQIAGDMGLIAFTLYLMFLIIPYKRLSAIERETLKEEHHSRYYYLGIGLQASLIGFMVSSFFLSVAYDWYGYFLVAYAVCFRRLYQQHKATLTPELK